MASILQRFQGLELLFGFGKWSSSRLQRSFDMDQRDGERRRSVLFSGHGVAFVVICVISRVIIIKMLCILLSDGI
jgi:hypothetical protein